MLGLGQYLTLSEDACRRVVRSEWKDPAAFPKGYAYGNLQMTNAPIWGASQERPSTVMTLGFIADPDPEFMFGNVRTVQTFAYASSVRKFQAVAEPANPEVLKIATHMPWIQPRFVIWSVKKSNGDAPSFLFDGRRQDLVEAEDFPWFIKECAKAAGEFFAKNNAVIDANGRYIG